MTPEGWWQPVSDAAVCALALVTVLGVWSGGRWWYLIVLAMPALIVVHRRARLRRDLVVAALVLVALGGSLSVRAWESAQPRTLGRYEGWSSLVTDPEPAGRGLRVVLEIESERFAAVVYGPARWRFEPRQAGERVELAGERRPATGPWARRAQVRHVVGEVEIERVGAWAEGTRLSLASNRLRTALRSSAAATMPPDHAALFTGLIIGDDTRQADAMVEQFRRAGLSHLTAVSGQNVAFVLAAAGVALRSLPRWSRLAATCAVIAWFVVLTRVEPSVLRAGTMAAMSAAACALGRERTGTRTLGLATIALVLIDPLLVWSVGFWLSVGATFGVVAIAPLIQPRLRGPGWWTNGLAVTLGAQLGVIVPSWVVFHRMPVLGIAANLVAVPVAGAVMLYGLPAALVASLFPQWGAVVVMAPAALGTRWVALVAEAASRLEPAGTAALVTWVVQLTIVAVLIGRGRTHRSPRPPRP